MYYDIYIERDVVQCIQMMFQIPQPLQLVSSSRRSKLEIVIQRSKVAVIGEKIRANFYRLACVFHEEIPLA